MSEEAQAEGLAAQCSELMREIDRLSKSNDVEWLALDVGMGQFKAMIMLKEHGRQTVGGLARLLKVSESSASLLLDKLVTREFVIRTTDPDDRRRTFVTLSPAADELMTRLRRVREGRLATWIKSLGGEELLALHSGLQALLAASTSAAVTGSTTGQGQA